MDDGHTEIVRTLARSKLPESSGCVVLGSRSLVTAAYVVGTQMSASRLPEGRVADMH